MSNHNQRPGEAAEFQTDDGRWHSCVIIEVRSDGYIVEPIFGKRGFAPTQFVRSVCGQARAAIAKAEGRQ